MDGTRHHDGAQQLRRRRRPGHHRDSGDPKLHETQDQRPPRRRGRRDAERLRQHPEPAVTLRHLRSADPGRQRNPRVWLPGHQAAEHVAGHRHRRDGCTALPAPDRTIPADGPVHGGSLNTYDYANQDPTNQFDLDGDCVFDPGVPTPSFFAKDGFPNWEVCNKKGRRIGRVKTAVTQSARVGGGGLCGKIGRAVHSKAFAQFAGRLYAATTGCLEFGEAGAVVGRVAPVVGTTGGAVAGCVGGAVLFQITPNTPPSGGGIPRRR